MNKYFFTIIIYLQSCAPTESVSTHDDIKVLQEFINSSSDIDMSLDVDSSGQVEPLELGTQRWENGRIIELNCYNVGLSGLIPESIGTLTELTEISLKGNNLSGEIPGSIGNLIHITQLSFANNALSGSLPDTIGNLKYLTRLDLSNNQLSGNIPISISSLSVMHTLLIDSNQFSDTLPYGICNIYNSNSDFDLSGNQFCQPFPYCLDAPDEIGPQSCDCTTGYDLIDGYCYSQTDIEMLQFMISDSINLYFDFDSSGNIEPLELGYQEWSNGRLETLDCYWNNISCNLSTILTENLSILDSLKVLNLNNNNMYGYIPENICNISSVLLENNDFCPPYHECIMPYLGEQDTSGCTTGE